MGSNGTVKNHISNNSNSQRHKDVVLFLKEELKRIQENRDVKTYNIEEEYAKTKKNRAVSVWIMLCSCFVVILLSAFLISLSISKKNSEISVSLNVFDDLNLKSLVNNVQKVQENYENALKNKALIQSRYEANLTKAGAKRDNELFLIKSLNLDNKKERDKRINTVNQEYEQTIAALEEQFAADIENADAEIAVYKEQLDNYDSAKIEAAKEHERALDSERQLKELESKMLSERYERRIYDLENTIKNERSSSQTELKSALTEVSSKYQSEINKLDPAITDLTAEQIIAENLPADSSIFNSQEILSRGTLLEDETASQGINSFQKNYDDYLYLHSTVRSIPQKHSIPSYTLAENVIVNKMGQLFADTAELLHEEKVELSKKLDSLTAKYNALEEKYRTLEKEHVALNSKYALLDTKYSALESDYEKSKKLPAMYDSALDVLLAQKNWNGVVLSSDSDGITVYVRKEFAEKITDGNAAYAEIVKAGKGNIEMRADRTFVFAPDTTDPKNNFNIQAVLPGTQIKILKK